MKNYILKPVYKSIYGEEFVSGCFENRMKMQKSIYLLQDLGISVGNYNFMWYKHGPYCQALQNDILSLGETDDIPVKFSIDAKYEIDRLRDILCNTDNIEYSTCDWAECLGSLHYIKENILPSTATKDMVIDELEKRKPHLNKHKDNIEAFDIVEELFN